MKLYRAKQSLAIESHTIQLPQFRDCMTHSAFRCTISEVKFTLTSRDPLIHRPYAKVFTYIFVCVFRQSTKIFKNRDDVSTVCLLCKSVSIGSSALAQHTRVSNSRTTLHALGTGCALTAVPRSTQPGSLNRVP